jgi:hypothetical protein
VSLKEGPCYWVVCDRCGERNDGGDFCIWVEPDGALDDVDGSGWWAEGGNHICPDCTPTDRDDDEDGDEQ